MKKLYFATLIFYGFVYYCQAQLNEALTNSVVINEWGTRQILVSLKSTLTSSNSVIIGDKELRADQPNFWLLYNTSSGGRGAFLPEYRHRFAFELKTANGIPIQKTVFGKSLSEPPESLTDKDGGRLSGVILPYGYKGFEFPVLTNLFNFPCNGIYIFELRCWAWQNSKKQFALSDPIRVRVVKEDINNPAANLPSNVKTNSPAK